MTENEALEELKTFPANCLDFKENQALHVATKALEEIQQYRAIGTVEEITKLINFLSFDDDTSIIEDLQMLVEYYSIGTVEEFKALKEKSVAKKVVPRHIRKYDGFDDGECPTCGNSVLRDGFLNDIYCDECGQKLDWQ